MFSEYCELVKFGKINIPFKNLNCDYFFIKSFNYKEISVYENFGIFVFYSKLMMFLLKYDKINIACCKIMVYKISWRM